MLSQNQISIVYRKTFDAFLDTLDKTRRHSIETAIMSYADGEITLVARDCHHKNERKKVGINSANVVVYYDDKGDTWEFIGGLEYITRVA